MAPAPGPGWPVRATLVRRRRSAMPRTAGGTARSGTGGPAGGPSRGSPRRREEGARERSRDPVGRTATEIVCMSRDATPRSRGGRDRRGCGWRERRVRRDRRVPSRSPPIHDPNRMRPARPVAGCRSGRVGGRAASRHRARSPRPARVHAGRPPGRQGRRGPSAALSVASPAGRRRQAQRRWRGTGGDRHEDRSSKNVSPADLVERGRWCGTDLRGPPQDRDLFAEPAPESASSSRRARIVEPFQEPSDPPQGDRRIRRRASVGWAVRTGLMTRSKRAAGTRASGDRLRDRRRGRRGGPGLIALLGQVHQLEVEAERPGHRLEAGRIEGRDLLRRLGEDPFAGRHPVARPVRRAAAGRDHPASDPLDEIDRSAPACPR